MMKKTRTLFLIALVLFSCNKEQKELVNSIPPISNATLESAVIYEANIRQYSPEGTFDEFTKDIPEIKKLGVKVIWLMPIFPISEHW